MKITYQGKQVETSATTVAAFLSEAGVDCGRAIVECDGELYAPGSDLSQVALKPDAVLDVFKIAAGG